MRRWIATYFAEEVAREKVTVPRGPVEPGSEAQIDYGRLGMWFDPATAQAGGGVGVRDGAVVFAAPVRAPGDPDGPNRVVRVSCRGV